MPTESRPAEPRPWSSRLRWDNPPVRPNLYTGPTPRATEGTWGASCNRPQRSRSNPSTFFANRVTNRPRARKAHRPRPPSRPVAPVPLCRLPPPGGGLPGRFDALFFPFFALPLAIRTRIGEKGRFSNGALASKHPPVFLPCAARKGARPEIVRTHPLPTAWTRTELRCRDIRVPHRQPGPVRREPLRRGGCSHRSPTSVSRGV